MYISSFKSHRGTHTGVLVNCVFIWVKKKNIVINRRQSTYSGNDMLAVAVSIIHFFIIYNYNLYGVISNF